MRISVVSIYWSLAFFHLCLLLSGCSHTPAVHQVENSRDLYLHRVTLVDVEDGGLVYNQAIHVRDGKIVGLYSADRDIPAGSHPIDLNGAYVSPGLVDMHVHLHDIKELTTHLVYGVTTVRNMRGFPAHLRWREKVKNGEWLGASLITASPSIAGPNSHALNTPVDTPEQAIAKVREYHGRGFDLIKVYGGHQPQVLAALLDEAKRLSIPVAKHAPHAEGAPLDVLRGAQSLEHVEDIFQGPLNFTFNEDLLRHEARKLAELGVPIVPTLATFNHLTELSQHKQEFVNANPTGQINPFFRHLYGKHSVARWLDASAEQTSWNLKEQDFLLHITKVLDEAGVPLLVGSDMGTMYMTAGISTHREMQLMQKAGLTPASILRSATLDSAEALGTSREYGSIAVGKRADLVVTTANPLSNIANLENPSAVVKHGQWLNRDTLDAILVSGDAPAGWFTGISMLLEHWWMD